MDLLQAARLSRLGDASTGLDKQDGASNKYADVYDHVIVGTAADADVSGNSDPFKRPELGPWLTVPKLIGSYDGIIASALDRLGRNARHLSALRDWAEDNNKKIIVISPPLQWPPEPDDLASPIIWDVLGRLAEYELKAITKRSVETQAYLRANGFLVGTIPYGYIAIAKGGSKHKTLAPDPETAPFVVAMFEHYLAGESLTQICEWLDAQGAKPAAWKEWNKKNQDKRGPEPIWNPATVSGILRNPVHAGRRKDASGRIVLKGFKSTVDPALWRAVNAKLAVSPHKHGTPSAGTALLTGVLFCKKCDGPMYRIKVPRRNGPEFFYRCTGTARKPSQCKNMIPMADIDGWVNMQLTGEPVGSLPVIVSVPVPGHGHEDEIAEVTQDISELDQDDPEYDAKHAALRADRKRLQALPAVPDTFDEQETSETVAGRWIGLDDSQRRDYLLRADAKVYASGKTPADGWRLDVERINVLRIA